MCTGSGRLNPGKGRVVLAEGGKHGRVEWGALGKRRVDQCVDWVWEGVRPA